MRTVTPDTFDRACQRASEGNYASRWDQVARILCRASDESRAVAAVEAALGGGRDAAVRTVQRFAEGME